MFAKTRFSNACSVCSLRSAELKSLECIALGSDSVQVSFMCHHLVFISPSDFRHAFAAIPTTASATPIALYIVVPLGELIFVVSCLEAASVHRKHK